MAAPNEYDIGALVTIQTSDTVGSTLTNSTTMVATVKKPDGTIITPTVANPSTGVYTAQVDTTGGPAGVWWYAFRGSGVAQGAEEQFFVVEPSKVV